MAGVSEGFLSQVMRSYEESEIGSFMSMIEDLGSKILNLKFQVKEMIEGSYVDFTHLPSENRKMVTESKILSEDINNLKNKIENEIKENLRNSTGELKKLTDHLQEVTLSSTIVNQMVALDEAFKLANKLQENKHYCKMAKSLIEANAVILKATEHNQDVEIFEALAEESTMIGGVFLEDMMNVWGECLRESTEEIQTNLSSYSLHLDVTRIDELEQMFQAMNIFDHLDMYFEKFASRLYKGMLLPIILQGATVRTDVEENDTFMIMTVEVDSTSGKSRYKEVFERIRQLLNFINLHLKINIEENVTFMNKLGGIISEDLVNALIEHCLADTIPSHSNMLDEFNAVITDTASIQTYLKVIGILQEDNVTLQEYTKNVEYLSANKTCRTLLEKARTIMKKDLYDMTDSDAEELMPSQSEINWGTHSEPSVKISAKMLDFPQCKISKSAAELLGVINQILADCETSTDLCAVRLFYTARNIVELYCAIVPKHHEKFLDMPQLAALFHNNCMFLAHHLMTLGHEKRRKLPEVLHSHTATFVDQVPELRSLATKVFLNHMKMQRDIVLDIIRNSGLATLREKRAVAPDTEKAVRQCLRQLDLLKSVWLNVLPLNVYCKAIGCLVNSFVDDLISRVTTVEDIPADMATQLGQIFQLVTSRSPLLFPEPKEVHRFVGQWAKFLELVLVLAASMKEITDRWANGKGPLADLFPPDQVRQLIRALFQNTDRRAAVLATIK